MSMDSESLVAISERDLEAVIAEVAREMSIQTANMAAGSSVMGEVVVRGPKGESWGVSVKIVRLADAALRPEVVPLDA